MPKVHRTHHTRLDSLSVAQYGVRTLFGIDVGPLEMVLHFFFPDFCGVRIGPGLPGGAFSFIAVTRQEWRLIMLLFDL